MIEEPGRAGVQHAWVTIIDDDLPIVSVADQTVSEDGGAIEFELELHEPGVVAARVDYATVVHSSAGDAAATPDQDYTHTSGTATFAPGVETATVSVMGGIGELKISDPPEGPSGDCPRTRGSGGARPWSLRPD